MLESAGADDHELVDLFDGRPTALQGEGRPDGHMRLHSDDSRREESVHIDVQMGGRVDMRRMPQKGQEFLECEKSPYDSSWFFQRWSFGWMNRIVWKGFRRPLEFGDMYSSMESTGELADALHERYAVYSKRYKSSFALALAMVRTQRKRMLIAAIPSFLLVFFSVMAALAMYVLIGLMSSEEATPWWEKALWMSAVIAFNTGQSIASQMAVFLLPAVGVRWRAAIMGCVYKKSLRVATLSQGNCNNLLVADPQNFFQFSFFLNRLWTSPMQMVISLIILCIWMGWSALAAIAVMVVLFPILYFVMRMVGISTDRVMELRDERVNLLTEVVQGVLVVKMFGWEGHMTRLVNAIRDREVRWLRAFSNSVAGLMFMMMTLPTLQSAALFTVFTLTGGELNAQVVFPALQILGLMVWAALELPWALSWLMECRTSLRRIDQFFRQPELDLASTLDESPAVAESLAETPVEIQGLSAEWHPPFELERSKKQKKKEQKEKEKKKTMDVEQHSFSEHAASLFSLRNITLVVPRGRLVAVVGRVGSGKSALIQACLGEMMIRSGRVRVRGQVAYVSQQAWIRNGSVRDNITFGLDFRRADYVAAIRACGLEADLRIMPAGDQTEIGEKGVNLSGGQKQRVALARAVYSDADVYFFDDVMSALDAHVGLHVFNHCVMGALAGKTRLLVTHQLQYLPRVDEVIVMEDGLIRMRGTYNELLASGIDLSNILAYEDETKNRHSTSLSSSTLSLPAETPSLSEPPSANFLTDDPLAMATLDENWLFSPHPNTPASSLHQSTSSLHHSSVSHFTEASMRQSTGAAPPNDLRVSGVSNSDGTQDVDKLGRMIDEEERMTGAVSTRVYWGYIKLYGIFFAGLLLILSILLQAGDGLSQVWLAFWSENDDPSLLWYYLGVYLMLTLLLSAVSSALRMFVWFNVALNVAKRIHTDLLTSILRAPMSFFHATPVGRIINRFSKDQEAVDSDLPDQSSDFVLCLMASLSTIIISTVLLPWLLVFYPIMLALFYLIMTMYRNVIRETGRLRSISNSPIIAQFIESVEGLVSIRAYGAGRALMKENQDMVDLNTRVMYVTFGAHRWLGVRADFLASCCFVFACALCLYLGNSIPTAVAALLLTLVLRMSGDLNWAVRSGSMLEMSMTRVERIFHYTDTEPEPPLELPCDKALSSSQWPRTGSLAFCGVSLRYRPDLPMALRDVSFSVKSGEKIGVVGRTGSGKSTMTQALFRLVHPESGHIEFDGVNVHQIGLHALRQNLSIIPQDPVLFSGPLRDNLDPEKAYSDSDVYEALRACQMDEYIRTQPGQLAMDVGTNGKNLSVGQRQLICMARALLRRSRVCVMDEATASVDQHTDTLIQKMIRNEFKPVTMLIIAHRLETIIDCDRCVVMDHGTVAEMDSPANLLLNPDSFFSKLVQSTGAENAQLLLSKVKRTEA